MFNSITLYIILGLLAITLGISFSARYMGWCCRCRVTDARGVARSRVVPLVLGRGDGIAGEKSGTDFIGDVLGRADSGDGERCHGGESRELAEDRVEPIRRGGGQHDQVRS